MLLRLWRRWARHLSEDGLGRKTWPRHWLPPSPSRVARAARPRMPPLLVLALAPVLVLVIQWAEKVHMQCRHRRHKQPPNTSSVRAPLVNLSYYLFWSLSFLFSSVHPVNTTVFSRNTFHRLTMQHKEEWLVFNAVELTPSTWNTHSAIVLPLVSEPPIATVLHKPASFLVGSMTQGRRQHSHSESESYSSTPSSTPSPASVAKPATAAFCNPIITAKYSSSPSASRAPAAPP